MIDIETHLRSYEHSSIIPSDTRIMCGRAANEVVRLRDELDSKVITISDAHGIIEGMTAALQSARDHLHIALNAARPVDREAATLDAYDAIAAALLGKT